jgi:hypothetical protein
MDRASASTPDIHASGLKMSAARCPTNTPSRGR